MSGIELALQCVHAGGYPRQDEMASWIEAALGAAGREACGWELTVRIVDEGESRQLNAAYRGRDKPTNVLSFPFEPPPGLPAAEAQILGDLVICAPVVASEAVAQGKPERDHWAHMVVHGTLHLLGHDHLEDGEAERMETLEKRALAGIGVPDPYERE